MARQQETRRQEPARRDARQDRRPPATREPERPSARNGGGRRVEEEKKTTALTTTTEQIPAEYEKQMREDAGHGLSTDAADNLTPFLYVLQPLSPQVLTSNPGFVEGAQPGDFWLPNTSDPIIPGDSGGYFQPSLLRQEWVEWVPRQRGGGLVARYPFEGESKPPAGAKRKPPDPERQSKVAGWGINGNDLIHTRYVPGHWWSDGKATPCVLSFKSTGHTVARGWMTKMNSIQWPDGTRKPAYSQLYKLTTKMRKNVAGEWYVVEVGENVPVFSPEGKEIVGEPKRAYDVGRALAYAFEKGEKDVDVSREEEVETSEEDEREV